MQPQFHRLRSLYTDIDVYKRQAFHNVSAFNYPEMQELEKIADRYNHISNDLETVIDDGANNQYHEDENETIYDKKEDKDTK